MILGGDAPDANNRMKFFTAENARSLARRIAKMEMQDRANCHFIVTNGPRTGKFSDGVEVQPNPHRTGKIDPVTQAFVDEIQTATGDRPDIFDFQFSQLPSAYQPILQSWNSTPNVGNLHVPGESSSMIAETTSFLDRVVVDEVPSMNEVHAKEVAQSFADGAADVLRLDGTLQRRQTAAGAGPKQPAAEKIAAEVLKLLNLDHT